MKWGVYTVTVDVIDSNGNYTTDATMGGTESGVDHGAGSSTATTTYHITVTDTIEGHNVTSTDVQERLKQVLQPLHLLVMAHLWHQVLLHLLSW